MEWLKFGADGLVVVASGSYNDLPTDYVYPSTGFVMSKAFADAFAAEWAAAWNAHDLERVLSHYTEDFTMTTPFIIRVTGNSTGALTGKENVGSYWAKALQKYPDLHFKVHDVLFCVNTICIYYDTILGLRAVEWLKFNDDGMVVEASGSYNSLPGLLG